MLFLTLSLKEMRKVRKGEVGMHSSKPTQILCFSCVSDQPGFLVGKILLSFLTCSYKDNESDCSVKSFFLDICSPRVCMSCCVTGTEDHVI